MLKTSLASATLALTFSCTSLAEPATKVLVSGLERPTYMTAPQNSSNFFYILEKKGRILLYDRDAGKLRDKPFMDIVDRVNSKANERGLLGMAFSPTFAKDKHFYLYYTDKEGSTQVSRFRVKTPNSIFCDPSTEEKLLSVKQPYGNHNGGWIDFGPDNMLYIALGDGGAANDPKNVAQDLSSKLGKMLRIDVSGDKGYKVPSDNPFVNTKNAHPEIYAYGLRNPWRNSWHNDHIYIADVGQNKWEEINIVSKDKLKGANFGWRLREGFHATPKKGVGGDRPENNIDPVHEYNHGAGPDQGLSVTGGYVYQGSVPELKGKYLFADYTIGNIWSLDFENGKATNHTHWTKALSHDGKNIPLISSFAEDPQNELYIISDKGKIFQIISK